MFKKFTAILCAAAIVCATFIPAFAVQKNPSLRVGLFYGNSALPTANLQNREGSGYKAGYMSNGSFTELFSTGAQKITVVKNKNVYQDAAGNFNESSGKAVGAYRVRFTAGYDTYADAKAALDQTTQSAGLAFLACEHGKYYINLDYFSTESYASTGITAFSAKFPGQAMEVVKPATNRMTIITTEGATPIFDYMGEELAISPSGAEKPITWFKGYSYYGIFLYRRMSGDNLTVVNYVNIQDYVKGVIPYEMNPKWHIEALKAQAICARSYAVGNINKHKNHQFDVCNSVDCQVYNGTGSATENSNASVDQTFGQYVYHDGKPAITFFHSSSGGSTENSENVWGNAVPYLRAVADDYEDLENAYNGIWSVSYTPAQVKQILEAKNYSIGTVSKVYVSEYTPAGNVLKLTVEDTGGKKLVFERERVRTILNSSSLNKTVNSMRYTVKTTGGANSPVIDASDANKHLDIIRFGTGLTFGGNGAFAGVVLPDLKNMGGESTATMFTFEGRGWGHNVGLSQYGAKGMAERGFTAEQIIKHYFTGVYIETGE